MGNPTASSLSPRALIAIGVLLFLTVVYRIAASHVSFLGNTAPLMAIAFAGALLLGMRYWWLPVALLIASDLLLGVWHGEGGIGAYTFMSALFYGLVAIAGSSLSRFGKTWPLMWCGTLFCSLLFYALANTYSWAVFTGYEKSPAGWWQAQTTGVPGIYPPAWMFLRNSLIADSLWCGLAGVVLFFVRVREGAEERAVKTAA